MEPLRVYIGYDPREAVAYTVAKASLLRHASVPVCVTPIRLARNERWGLIQRPWRVYRGGIWDTISEAPQSTEFALSRFLTPFLAQEGLALFVDSDVVFMEDVARLFALADPLYAVQVVKHSGIEQGGARKMDDQTQTAYARKNWSSVMLWNCDHAAHMGLHLSHLSSNPGRDLHRFFWLQEDEIGALPPEWNWLVGVQPKPVAPKVAHFTLGGPFLIDWKEAEHDEIWLDAAADCRTARGTRFTG